MHRRSGEEAQTSLHVLAAGSLRASFDALAAEWSAGGELPATLSYANARDLAARIKDGEPADVYASASPEHPAALHALGLLDEPRPIATNRLVVAVPVGSAAREPDVLALPGTRVVIEVEGIPLGDYTRVLLERWGEARGRDFVSTVMANVVRQEESVAAVLQRLRRGEADAAVLYNTDVQTAGGRLRAIEAPVPVFGTYVAATVRASRQPDVARAWLALITGPVGGRILRAAGFTVNR
jgi:molybdate transport system substrate-binding protein